MLKGHTKYVRPCSNEITPNENQKLLFYCIKFYLYTFITIDIVPIINTVLYFIFNRLRKIAKSGH
jgi:hypothetical protein